MGRISVVTVAGSLAGALLAREASAVVACTAADVIAQDAGCPPGSGPCSITADVDVGDGCVLDFGARPVTVRATIDVGPGAVTLRAGSLTVAPGGRLLGIGDRGSPPRDRGGRLTIATAGGVDVQAAGSTPARIDVSATNAPGRVVVEAGGSVTIAGQVRANRLTESASGGEVEIRAVGDVVVAAGAQLAMIGGTGGNGGVLRLAATRDVRLAAPVDVHGGEGGELVVAAGGTVRLADVDAGANGDAGFGGTLEITGARVELLGVIDMRGSTAIDGSSGGDGGDLTVEALLGDLVVTRNVLVEGAGPDGSGGGVLLAARGTVEIQLGATLSARANGGEGDGGALEIVADGALRAAGPIDVSGGSGGGVVDVTAGRDATVGRVDASGRNAASFGGDVFLAAGDAGTGHVVLQDRVDVRAAGCSAEFGCGSGGFTDVDGCDVTIGAGAALLARGPSGGRNTVTVRRALTLLGELNATRTDAAGVDGENRLFHPLGVPVLPGGVVVPAAAVTPVASCVLPGQTGCLDPCPTCGDGVVDFPETCDDGGGAPASCDGCSVVCQIEQCDDGRACTTDDCDPAIGCGHLPLPNGTPCDDATVCNGTERCTDGFCRAGPPPDCDDGNGCTADACDALAGCTHAPAVGAPCDDGDACTVGDACTAAAVCGGAPRVCSDGEPCTADGCDPATGCVFTPRTGACDDGRFCTVDDACVAGTCVGGPPRACADADPCTVDTCNETTDACEHTPGAGCCGNGTIDPGETCDDGNRIDGDGCSATCRDAACGDGVVDELRGEQCDDGGTAPGDGCSAACFLEPPPAAELIAGKGSARPDCALEWRMVNPVHDAKGVAHVKQTCVDGDARCDHGTAAGECLFEVWLCANNQDPALPTCAPGAPGLGIVVDVTLKRPGPRDDAPADVGNRVQLLAAAAAVTGGGPGVCGPRMLLRVPRKSPTAKGTKGLRVQGVTDGGQRDSDVLKLLCLP